MKRRTYLLLLAACGFAAIAVFLVLPAMGSEGAAAAAATTGELNGDNRAVMALAAMGSVAFACFTSAYALAKIGAAAMGTMAERPEVGGRALVFLGMAEGIAIYGLIIAIMILNKI